VSAAAHVRVPPHRGTRAPSLRLSTAPDAPVVNALIDARANALHVENSSVGDPRMYLRDANRQYAPTVTQRVPAPRLGVRAVDADWYPSSIFMKTPRPPRCVSICVLAMISASARAEPI
jgi:hypothetical protein